MKISVIDKKSEYISVFDKKMIRFMLENKLSKCQSLKKKCEILIYEQIDVLSIKISDLVSTGWINRKVKIKIVADKNVFRKTRKIR